VYLRGSLQDDIVLATDAMNKLQGAVLPSSERGGIRIEYARTKMGDVVSGLRVYCRPRHVYLLKDWEPLQNHAIKCVDVVLVGRQDPSPSLKYIG